MRFMRLAACAVAFAVVGGIAVAEDMDIKALQAKLAAQEARLNDLQAKMGSGKAEAPANIVSMKKNAKVTVGGTVDTRYVFGNGDVETLRASQITSGDGKSGNFNVAGGGYRVDRFDGDANAFTTGNDGNMQTLTTATWATKSYSTGNLFVDSANVYVQAEVNENFDALIRINGHDHNRASGIAQQAWFRWKNICNSGWGVKVGRDALTFALGKPVGMFDAWMQDNGGQSMGSLADIDTQDFTVNDLADGTKGPNTDFNGTYVWQDDQDTNTINGTRTQSFEGMFRNGTTLPTHFAYGVSRVMQINPYWESQDGKYRFDFTFFQGMDSRDGAYMQADTRTGRNGDRESTNYGLGSAAVKFTWKPTEDWTIAAAAINMYSNNDKYTGTIIPSYSQHQTGGLTGEHNIGNVNQRADNDVVVHLGFNWTPSALCQKLTIWAQANNEWNAGWKDDLDVFAANFGLAYKMTDKLTAFAQGDYMYADNEHAVNWAKAEGWRSYIGLNYATSYGVAFEAGWAHDQMDYENNAGVTHTKIKGDTLYLQSAFNF